MEGGRGGALQRGEALAPSQRLADEFGVLCAERIRPKVDRDQDPHESADDGEIVD